MPVDSYRWLPRSLKAYYQALPIEAPDPRPFTPMTVPVSEATIALITTGGLHTPDQEPFDLDRERREPAWGDPSFRELPADLAQDDVRAAHLHYNTDDVLADVNCVFPIERVRAQAGAVAPTNFSFMGFQMDQSEQLGTHVPQVIDRLRRDAVDGVLLTPA